MKGKRQLWQNLRKGTISSPQRPGIFEPPRWNLAAPFHPLSISAAAPDVSSSSEVSSFPFGDAQSAVVPQPGSPHHRAIKSAGKNPAETSLLRHNSKKKGAAGMRRGAPGLFSALMCPGAAGAFPGCRASCAGLQGAKRMRRERSSTRLSAPGVPKSPWSRGLVLFWGRVLPQPCRVPMSRCVEGLGNVGITAGPEHPDMRGS